MASTGQDATIWRGTDNEFRFTIEDDADLTGESLYYVVAKHPGGVALLTVSTLTDPAITMESNVATVPIGDADSLLLDPGVYRHELYTVEEDVRLVLATGRLLVLPSQVAQHETVSE